MCPDRRHVYQVLREKGVPKEAVCLPDVGRGRLRWVEIGLKWADPGRNMFGVRDPSAIPHLMTSNEDPMNHPHVVHV
jgi:hypothetical protein